MMASLRGAVQYLTRAILPKRNVSTSSVCALRKMELTEDGKTVTIKAVPAPSPRTGQLLDIPARGRACYMCSLNLCIKHTDVLILSQFVRSDGCLLPRRVSGLCRYQQKRIRSLVAMSQKAGLMPNLTPSASKKDPKKRYGYKKFNKYFDESTIKEPRIKKYHIEKMVAEDRVVV